MPDLTGFRAGQLYDITGRLAPAPLSRLPDGVDFVDDPRRGGQCAVHRAALGDYAQSLALVWRERSPQNNIPADQFDLGVAVFLTFFAVSGVDPFVAELDVDPFQGPFLTLGVQRKGH